MFCFALQLLIEVKYLLKTLAISQGLMIVFSLSESALGTVDMTFFIIIIDVTRKVFKSVSDHFGTLCIIGLMPFHVFLNCSD